MLPSVLMLLDYAAEGVSTPVVAQEFYLRDRDDGVTGDYFLLLESGDYLLLELVYPTIPGIELRLTDTRLHYRLADTRLHFRVNEDN